MQATPVIAIFDVGKTNKKLFLFDESYQMVYEDSIQLPEIADEDGFPCEDVERLSAWIKYSCKQLLAEKKYAVKAINFSAYGASFVHIDQHYERVTPLYNYLKPFPEKLKQQFYTTYGGRDVVSLQTASPVMGNLNSGMQLYWLKYEKPELFNRIEFSLHLPQYLSYLVTHRNDADITSLGCHTGLWNFTKNDYHKWVYEEGVNTKFAPIYNGSTVINVSRGDQQLPVGVGLHDSSAALIPYLTSFHEPFVLISTGTWCISLNPFNDTPLTPEELQQDCLCYLTYEGKPVKASRLFAGSDHEEQVKRLAVRFGVTTDFYKSITYNAAYIHQFIGTEIRQRIREMGKKITAGAKGSAFGSWELKEFASYEEAYHQLLVDIIVQQVASTALVLRGSPVKRIYVDGGFSKNPVYMQLLAAAFPELEVFAASMAQASAMGAALAIHASWNTKPLLNNIIELKYYGVTQNA